LRDSRAHDEQLHGVTQRERFKRRKIFGIGECKRRRAKSYFARDVQRFAARRENRNLGRVSQNVVGKLRARVDQVFTVVEDEEKIFCAEKIAEEIGKRATGLFLQTKDGGDSLQNQVRIRERREVNEPDTIEETTTRWVVATEIARDLDREPGFAASARAGQREQARARQTFQVFKTWKV
jgi:hypothetical protein